MVLILLINITLLDGLDHWPKRVLVTKGIRIALRADPIEMPIFNKAPREYEDKGHEIWRFEGTTRLDLSLPDDSDVVLYESGFIVIVPMKADEHDYELMSRLKANLDKLPDWSVLKEDK